MDGSSAAVTDREAEVLRHLAAGRSNAQIAHALHISVRTVEHHVSSLLRKLGVADRRGLAELAGPQTPAGPGGRRGEVVGLPHGRGTFVGRQPDRALVLGAFADHRLVSVVGPGGMGKTRLAAVLAPELARGFPAGTAFVDLVPVRPGLVAAAVADVLGVSELPGQELSHTIAGRLASGRYLLLLDNCEHVVEDAGTLVGVLLDRCPNVAVLATTRQRLGLPGERVVQLGPLDTEPDGVRLFLDRAAAGDPELELDRPVVAEICEHLDGMPLAIEIAAARAASLGQDGLRAAMTDQARLVHGARGVAVRHASLRAVMDWSYDLLSDAERSMLRGLAVFAGTFDLAAAAEVAAVPDLAAAADLLGRLVDSSLVVRVTSAGSTRWRLLAVVRAFADARTDAAERAELTARHLSWAIGTATRLQQLLEGRPAGPAGGRTGWVRASGSDRMDRSAEVDAVLDDLRVAMARSASGPDPGVHRLARALAQLTFARGHHAEARDLYVEAAARAATDEEAYDDLLGAAEVAVAGSDTVGGADLFLRAARRAGDRGNAAAGAWAAAVETQIRFGYEYRSGRPPSELLAAARREADPDDPLVSAMIAIATAWHQVGRSDAGAADAARVAVDRARETGDPIVTLRALDALSATLIEQGRIRKALEVADERLGLLKGLPRHVPAAATEISDTFQVGINLAISSGELVMAGEFLDRAEAEDPTANPFVAIPRRIAVLVLSGRLAEAIEQGDELWAAWQRDGTDRRWLASAVNLVALAHGLSGDGQFEQWCDRTARVAMADREQTDWLDTRVAFARARTALHTGDFTAAPLLVDKAFAAVPGWAHRSDGYARASGAELAVAAGLPDAADRIIAAEPFAAENRWAAATLTRARGRLHQNRAALRAAADLYAAIGAQFEQAVTHQLLRPDPGA